MRRPYEVFLRHGRALLAQVAATRREVAAVRSLEAGELLLGAPGMVAGHLLPPVLDAFLEGRPGLRLRVVQAGAEEIGERVLRGDLDLGIVADWRTPEGLATTLLAEHPMVACIAEGSSLAGRSRLDWGELLAQPLLSFPRGYHQRTRLDEAARRLGVAPHVLVEAESVPLILELVRRGRGTATLLACAAERQPGVRAVPLPDDAVVPIALCRRARAPVSALAEAFQDHLASHLGV
ncbi:MAG TPA: LysR family transcriptional regulator substrate-binding protein [Azospirillum sp.]|nr:LysR family transcriptional regulator substrate-binding protein [Azospirillum sp.]